MPSNGWQTLGTGSLLGYLRADLKKAKELVWLIGPWIDAWFAEALVAALPGAVRLRVVTRPPSGANSRFGEHATAARSYFAQRANTEVRLLTNLHAKLVVVGTAHVYCGSANWYRYSLEESSEIVLRGPASEASGLFDELQVIWDKASATATAAPTPPAHKDAMAEGYKEEVTDPIAAAKLREVPGSFVLSRPPRRGR